MVIIPQVNAFIDGLKTAKEEGPLIPLIYSI